MSRPGDICDICLEHIDEGEVVIFHVEGGRAIMRSHRRCAIELFREVYERP